MTESDDHSSFIKNYIKKESAYLIMIVLSVIGFAVTDVSTGEGAFYWQIMIPVFCLTCIITRWKHSADHGMSHMQLIGKQILHWGAFFMAMRLIYLPVVQQNISLPITGMIVVLLLALSIFLAGVYIGWRFCIVGIFLGLTVVAASYLQEITLFIVFAGLLLIAASLIWAKYMLSDG